MGGSSFDIIAQEILHQKQLMDQMQAENQELRRQLADLRDGRGIFVDIGGRRFALVGEMSNGHSTEQIETAQTAQLAQVVQTTHEADEMGTVEEEEFPAADEQDVVSPFYDYDEEEEGTPTRSLPALDIPAQPERETPLPTTHFLVENEPAMPSFLEELMIDEFTTAAQNPKAIWSAPEPKAQAPQTPLPLSDEETKAALRRELIGSFLLE